MITKILGSKNGKGPSKVGLLKGDTFYEVLRREGEYPGQIVVTHPERVLELLEDIAEDEANLRLWLRVVRDNDPVAYGDLVVVQAINRSSQGDPVILSSWKKYKEA